MGVFHHLPGEAHVVLVGVLGAVQHYRGEARVDAGLGQLEGVAVVQVQGHREVGAHGLGHLQGPLHQVGDHDRVQVLAGAAGALQDDRRLGLRAALDDPLDLLHVVEVIGRHGVMPRQGPLEHLPGVHQP